MPTVHRTSSPRPAPGAPVAVLALAALLAACGPAQRGASNAEPDTTAAETASVPVAGRMPMAGMPGMGGMMGRTGAPAPGSSTAPGPPLACGTPDPAAIARGRAVYAHATCTTCHGPDAHGTGIAPDLADRTWIDATGSESSIATVIRDGVAHPRQYPAPMPPAGGAPLDARQICDVAAWVYSLSH